MAIPFTCIGERKMERYYDFSFRGKKLRLYFTMNALLEAQEAYDTDFGDFYTGTEREVFDRKIYLLSLLSYEGKRVFAEQELDGISMTELSDVMPFEMIDINNALGEATSRGFQREFEPEEVDEGLMELKKKSKSKGSREQKQSKQEES